MHLPNVTLMTNSRVTRLLTNSTGTAVTAVEVIHSGSAYGSARVCRDQALHAASKNGDTAIYTAGLFAVCAGAINSAVILLASANDKHPNWPRQPLRSGWTQLHVPSGRRAARHFNQRNEDSYTKTWGTNDFYLKDSDPAYPFPLGQVQPVGSFHFEMMKGDAPSLTPGFVLEGMKHHAVPWWLTTEDLPDPDNRVTLHNTTPLSVQSQQPGLVRRSPIRRHWPYERVRARHGRRARAESNFLTRQTMSSHSIV